MTKYLSIIVLVAVFVSCKKDNKPAKPEEEKLLIDSIISVEPNNDQTIKRNYDYDSRNRISKFTEEIIHRNKGSISEIIYQYNDQDDLLKSIYKHKGDVMTREYSYKGDTEIIEKTSFNGGWAAPFTELYTVQNGKIIGSLSDLPGSSYISYEYHETGDLKKWYLTEYEYGNKKSPFIYSGSKRPLLYEAVLGFKNEILKSTAKYNNNNTEVYTYSYKYNSSGYPVEASVSFNNAPLQTKITYKYIAAK